MEPQDQTPRPDPRVDVDCYVRADAVSDPIEADLASLEALAGDGAINDLTVRTWPDEVVLSPVTEDSLAVERYRTFERWATQWAVRIDPAFRRETRRSELTGETREVLLTPALCLAVSVDGHLAEVFPHRSKGTTYGTDEAIAALAEGVPSVSGPAPTPSRPGHCPECDVRPTTGQGLYACPECGWVAVASGSGTLTRVEEPPSADGSQSEDAPLLR